MPGCKRFTGVNFFFCNQCHGRVNSLANDVETYV
jgi:hypothetical protein